MKIIVLGGDGFCGWPTSLHLSKLGHEIIIVDNLSHRKIDVELEIGSLTPIQPISTRLEAWKKVSGKTIEFTDFDVAENYHRLLSLLNEFEPDTVIHFAEQSSAPYSMKSAWHKRYSVDNNIGATHSLLAATVESRVNPHLIHLGTMGVYGYGSPGIVIPEGYLNVKLETGTGELISQEILYPSNPGSVYHMTKTMDQLMFAYYNKNDGLKITDLHQGIVWGTQTEDTRLDDRLINRFNYDGDYGTVLNRFLMQAAIGHPLTVYGTGGQTRAFIHLQNTVQCIEIAVSTPPQTGERVNIFNQVTEIHKIRDLAELVAELTGAEIDFIENPRNEAEENDLAVTHTRFNELGLEPITLNPGLMSEVVEIADRYKDNCDILRIPSTSYWTQSDA